MPEDSPSLDSYQQGIPDALPDPARGRKRFRLVLAALFLVVLGLGAYALLKSPTGAAVLGRGEITGQVVSGDQQPIPAEMVILGTDLKNIAQPDGSFRFSGIPAGEVILVVGWQGQAVEVPAAVPAGGQVDVGQIILQTTATP